MEIAEETEPSPHNEIQDNAKKDNTENVANTTFYPETAFPFMDKQKSKEQKNNPSQRKLTYYHKPNGDSQETDNPKKENPKTDNPKTENPTLLINNNTNKLSNKEITQSSIIKSSNTRYISTLKDVVKTDDDFIQSQDKVENNQDQTLGLEKKGEKDVLAKPEFIQEVQAILEKEFSKKTVEQAIEKCSGKEIRADSIEKYLRKVCLQIQEASLKRFPEKRKKASGENIYKATRHLDDLEE
jgi:ABC-type uncharacterized transport system involved in gliding motility auxiliary subunit